MSAARVGTTAFFIGCFAVLLVTFPSPSAARQLRVVAQDNARAGIANLRDLDVNVDAIIFNDLRGNGNDIRSNIFANMAQTRLNSQVEKLRAEVSTIVSNSVQGSDNVVDNLIGVLAANDAILSNVNATLEAYAINELNGDRNQLSNIQWYDLVGSNSKLLEDINLAISGLTYNKVGDALLNGTTASDNFLGNELGIAAGVGNTFNADGTVMPGSVSDLAGSILPDFDPRSFTAKNVSVIIDAVLLNEVASGNGNYLENVMKVAALSGADMKNVVANIEGILVNQVAGDNNDLSNIVNMALGLCDRGRPCSLEDFSVDVSTVLLNDVTGNKNLVSNLVDISVGNNADIGISDKLDSLREATVNIEAIIVNTLKNDLLAGVDSNNIRNTVAVEALTNSKIRDVKATISAIIANEVKGSLNNLENSINIQLGNGRGKR